MWDITSIWLQPAACHSTCIVQPDHAGLHSRSPAKSVKPSSDNNSISILDYFTASFLAFNFPNSPVSALLNFCAPAKGFEWKFALIPPGCGRALHSSKPLHATSTAAALLCFLNLAVSPLSHLASLWTPLWCDYLPIPVSEESLETEKSSLLFYFLENHSLPWLPLCHVP